MIVRELIEQLQRQSPDAVVVVLQGRDVEFWYDPANNVAEGYYSQRRAAFRAREFSDDRRAGRGESPDTVRAVAIRVI